MAGAMSPFPRPDAQDDSALCPALRLPTTEVIDDDPRSGKRKKRSSEDESKGEVAQLKSTMEATPKGVIVQRGVTRSVKLDNNLLSSLDGFKGAMSAILVAPMRLTWVDLSCNKLTEVHEVRKRRRRLRARVWRTAASLTPLVPIPCSQELLEFTNLTVLYLHGNGITKLSEVRKLQKLQQLKSLTLHGNPVEEVPSYRFTVVATMPELRSLDFSPVTRVERDKAVAWRSMRRPRRRDHEA